MPSCITCGKSYERERSLIRYHYYEHPDHAPESWESCKSCEKVFKSTKGMRIHHKKEHDESVAHTETCVFCGDEFTAKPSHERRFCSHDCWYEFKKAQESETWYDTAAAKEFRQAVFERDDYTCQDCGATDKYLNAHHIKRRFEHPEHADNPENGVTLCVDCHANRHAESGEEQVAMMLRKQKS